MAHAVVALPQTVALGSAASTHKQRAGNVPKPIGWRVAGDELFLPPVVREQRRQANEHWANCATGYRPEPAEAVQPVKLGKLLPDLPQEHATHGALYIERVVKRQSKHWHRVAQAGIDALLADVVGEDNADSSTSSSGAAIVAQGRDSISPRKEDVADLLMTPEEAEAKRKIWTELHNDFLPLLHEKEKRRKEMQALKAAALKSRSRRYLASYKLAELQQEDLRAALMDKAQTTVASCGEQPHGKDDDSMSDDVIEEDDLKFMQYGGNAKEAGGARDGPRSSLLSGQAHVPGTHDATRGGTAARSLPQPPAARSFPQRPAGNRGHAGGARDDSRSNLVGGQAHAQGANGTTREGMAVRRLPQPAAAIRQARCQERKRSMSNPFHSPPAKRRCGRREGQETRHPFRERVTRRIKGHMYWAKRFKH
eukprot:TRINITY_DN45273_c0_g1_i3.p1 TRINITY_DN45273_c0_g1~~TRINITY_DN45273_c0_g1_i3.p1  ORF type:complete len:424 (+),score=80.06 TRINITY_DN45273_c0_g1_i3:117-1388(+)